MSLSAARSSRWVAPIMLSLPFLPLIAMGTYLRTDVLTVIERTPDERRYAYQARSVVRGGIAATRALVDEYNSTAWLWTDPPPTRVGYVYPLAGVMTLTSRQDEVAGSYLSSASSILTLCLLALLGARFFDPWATVYALLFMAVSPMDLAIARRCWADAPFALVGLLLIYFCCEISRKPRRIWYTLFFLAGGYFLLMKELAAVLYALCVAWLAGWAFFRDRSPRRAAIVLVCASAVAGASFALLAWLAGGASKVFLLLGHVKDTIPRNRYALQYQSGPWYDFLRMAWALSPVSVYASVVGAAAVLVRMVREATDTSKTSRAIHGGILFCVAGFTLAVMLAPYSLNLRYLSVLYAPFYLLGGLGVSYAFSVAKAARGGYFLYASLVLIVAAMLGGAMSDYEAFQPIFIVEGTADLSARFLFDRAPERFF